MQILNGALWYVSRNKRESESALTRATYSSRIPLHTAENVQWSGFENHCDNDSFSQQIFFIRILWIIKDVSNETLRESNQ